MADLLDIREILTRFPRHYVLLDRCRFDEFHEVTQGRVVRASSERDQVYNALREHPNSVIIYTGPVGSDLEGAFLDHGRVWEACAAD
ncbi:MAG: hypothetical protein AB7O52_01840 [Planctomycetota bacterium]